MSEETHSFKGRRMKINVHPEGWIEMNYSIPNQDITLTFRPEQAEKLALKLLDAAKRARPGEPE